MANTYYSYCCGKFVEKNIERMDLIRKGIVPEKGYHCSKCHKQLTVYGNPVLPEDVQAYKDAQKNTKKHFNIKGNLVEVLPNGDLNLMGKIYKKAELGCECYDYDKKRLGYVIYDYYGKYLTSIWMDYSNTELYLANAEFEARLKQGKLCCDSLSYYNHVLNNIDELKKDGLLLSFLERKGIKVGKNGKIY